MAEEISEKRQKASLRLKEKLNFYLSKLYMPSAEIVFSKIELNASGFDKAEIIINDIDINTISTGEFNRLRVAMLASKLEYEDKEKTLFLDEIDANLSGEESMSVAEVLKYLSVKYQIFAISHQPQLASMANKHFLVRKEGGKSVVKDLNMEERIEEIARIIGGKEKSEKAVEYAKELLKDAK
jgi:DNA repair protein RecN (Recombination protein N)